MEIRLQPRQEAFASSSADIVIFGGAAGGGKTYALLLEPLRHINNSKFGAVIFRRTIPEITNEGGMWDESLDIYPMIGGRANKNERRHYFPTNAKVTFSHLQHEKTLEDWKGAQIPLIEFDQLETFTEKMFFYMLTRNRSKCGVKPYMRCSANPQPGWLADFIDWWIAEDGYADLSRSGIIRWFVRDDEQIFWADHRQELVDKFGKESRPKSATFIVSTIYDNPILLKNNPEYLANLKAQNLVDRERLLGDPKRGGNWKIEPEAGKVYNRGWFKIVDAVPAGGIECSGWDFAATEKQMDDKNKDPDFTARVRMRKVAGNYYITDVWQERLDPAPSERRWKSQTRTDYFYAQEGGAIFRVRFGRGLGDAGKRDARRMVGMLSGYDVKPYRESGDKVTRTKPLASQAEIGNVYLLKAHWNKLFLDHMHSFPDGAHDDIKDAADNAFRGCEEPIPKGIQVYEY